ncbi:MoaD/ThiS family protein [Hydrogenibacillus schlegelii]|uniref:Molybdopterin synthase sulfur carrier subunit n=1 Tax=Hydrogenibacillus schlegelii TaxID=1484 RepID=A0A132MZH4_HYDSH|nr:MoaD/ThiS family protein [Hydrogenibacillus schlegelii]KWX03308.1 hypothetical protein TR75_08710 [Hydrogenibacillus schlegelii]OAR03924.1 hypothetical protein SA87_03610 [Hydrogenibacillus schlegelii]PTQ52385.1 MAG: Molybdenum cofactor biosynthesis protein MoaD [Hydrogenibacillus schlegelii]
MNGKNGGLDRSTVTVLLFAGLGEKVGRTLSWPWREGLTVAELLDELAARYPEVAVYRPTVMTAVNAAYRPVDHPLRPGDEVALIPPVSGG